MGMTDSVIFVSSKEYDDDDSEYRSEKDVQLIP